MGVNSFSRPTSSTVNMVLASSGPEQLTKMFQVSLTTYIFETLLWVYFEIHPMHLFRCSPGSLLKYNTEKLQCFGYVMQKSCSIIWTLIGLWKYSWFRYVSSKHNGILWQMQEGTVSVVSVAIHGGKKGRVKRNIFFLLWPALL